MSDFRVGVVGLGKVGQALFQMLRGNGFQVTAVYNRTLSVALDLAQDMSVFVADEPSHIVDHCDLVIVSVTDDAIPLMIRALCNADWEGKAVVHVSGALNTAILNPVYERGGMVGSFHPAVPFADVTSAQRALVGATFAIEASHAILKNWLAEIIESCDGYLLEIPAGKKAQYHLALVVASNYMVTLYAVAEKLLLDVCDDKTAIDNALDTLMSATMDNLIEQGVPSALTGPLVRADVKTLQSHLTAIQDNLLLSETYINLAKLSYPMLVARGIDVTPIHNVLKETRDASDDT